MSAYSEIFDGLASGEVVPYLGPGVLRDVTYSDGTPVPSDGEPLILAMTGGKPLNPRLMTEFPRAAMHLELSKGRPFLVNFLQKTYGASAYQGGAVHHWLAEMALPYVIDTNRDVRLQNLWNDRPHTLVVGIARLTADWHRFRLFEYDGAAYRDVTMDNVDPDLPILFKPLGTPRPKATFVASDADFVDYITELMGGYAVPPFVKSRRVGKQYLILGLSLRRDTPRMILSDLIADAGERAGWALIKEPTAKERRYCATKNLEIIESDAEEFLNENRPELSTGVA